MAFEKKNWLDRECEYPDRRLLNPTDGGAARSFTVARDEGLIYEEGDRFNAATMNDFEDRVQAADIAAAAALAAHTGNKGNPHTVTKTQVGLGNVDNNQQATKSEFNTHLADKGNPHAVTKSQVGLGSVDNTQQATKSEFNTHAGDTANPHKVTAKQAGALPISGGVLTGNLTTGVNGIAFANGANHMQAFMGAGDWGDANFDFRNTGSGFLFRTENGSELLPIYASNISGPCSARYKRDVTPLPREAAEALMALPVYRYFYNEDSGFADSRPHAGLLAEEAEAVDESYVYRKPDGRVEGVNYPALVPVLLRLLQAQGEDIAALEGRLAALEADVRGSARGADKTQQNNKEGEADGSV